MIDYRFLRALQSQFPFLLEIKVAAQRQMRLALKRPFEPDFQILQSCPTEAPSILDIGANRGQSIDAILMFRPSAHIVAFEPNDRLASRLTQRFTKNDQIRVENTGLGAAPSDHTLYIPVYNGFEYDGLASFDREEAVGWLNEETLAGFSERKLSIREMPCHVTTVDSYGLAPDMIKLDVQGFEAEVLKGAEATLQAHAPLILMENNPDADTLLTGWGWSRHALVGDRLLAGEIGALNTFYTLEQTLENWPAFRTGQLTAAALAPAL